VTDADVKRYYVKQVNAWGGGQEWQCEAGQLDRPIGCERHAEHHWCDTCKGYYGVPHGGDGFGIHDGPNAHPNQFAFDRDQCACRPCKQATGRE
jgi:hypothetical protein